MVRFINFYNVLHPRYVTSFSYRYNDPIEAQIFLSFYLLDPKNRDEELKLLFEDLLKDHCVLEAQDLSDNELAKAHVRYLIGGRIDVLLLMNIIWFL